MLYSRPAATGTPGVRGSRAGSYGGSYRGGYGGAGGAYGGAGRVGGAGGSVGAASAFPTPVGRLEGGPSGRAVLFGDEQTSGGQFFRAIDNYLKAQRVRFDEVRLEFAPLAPSAAWNGCIGVCSPFIGFDQVCLGSAQPASSTARLAAAFLLGKEAASRAIPKLQVL